MVIVSFVNFTKVIVDQRVVCANDYYNILTFPPPPPPSNPLLPSFLIYLLSLKRELVITNTNTTTRHEELKLLISLNLHLVCPLWSHAKASFWTLCSYLS
jgi:hypothetical protein